MNQFRLVQAVDRFSHRVVVAASPAADRRLDACLGQPFAVANDDVLGTPVAVMNQRSVIARPVSVPGLFCCVYNEGRSHRRANRPADDGSGEHVDHERHMEPALPRRNVREIRNPQLAP